jgi:hypothetical protein
LKKDPTPQKLLTHFKRQTQKESLNTTLFHLALGVLYRGCCALFGATKIGFVRLRTDRTIALANFWGPQAQLQGSSAVKFAPLGQVILLRSEIFAAQM